MLVVYGYVDIASSVNISHTVTLIGELLFPDQRFQYEEGLRDEIPGYTLKQEVFGLCAVVHGGDVIEEGEHQGKYSCRLEVLPGKSSRTQLGITHWLGIGEWVAQILAGVSEFDIIQWLPAEKDLIGRYTDR